jgi:molybdenum cofactor cytidylyltransferase
MGPSNKLLLEIGGQPLVRRTVERVLAASLATVVVVTGHEDAAVRAALKDLPITVSHNPRYAEGLSTSLRVGLDALPPEIDGAMIVLGDMPDLVPDHLKRLIERFDPGSGRAIGVPTHRGKRGNPVLWGRGFFDEMRGMAGDVGAKALIGANESLVYEVEFDDTGVVTDLDTPEEWSEYVRRLSGKGPSGGP